MTKVKKGKSEIFEDDTDTDDDDEDNDMYELLQRDMNANDAGHDDSSDNTSDSVSTWSTSAKILMLTFLDILCGM